MRPARGVRSKNAPQALQSAEALIRHGPADRPSAQLIGPGARPPESASARQWLKASFGETSPEPWRRRRPSSGNRRRCIFPRVGRGAVARCASAQWVPLTRDLHITCDARAAIHLGHALGAHEHARETVPRGSAPASQPPPANTSRHLRNPRPARSTMRAALRGSLRSCATPRCGRRAPISDRRPTAA